MRANEVHQVVIVGGGFTGIRVAKSLGGAAVQVTLLDRRNHHLFQPLPSNSPGHTEIVPRSGIARDATGGPR